MSGEKIMAKVKAGMLEVKKECRALSINENMMTNFLFSSRSMKAGQHHLYDDIDKHFVESPIKDEEFDSWVSRLLLGVY